jgi:hypothetical protein
VKKYPDIGQGAASAEAQSPVPGSLPDDKTSRDARQRCHSLTLGIYPDKLLPKASLQAKVSAAMRAKCVTILALLLLHHQYLCHFNA